MEKTGVAYTGVPSKEELAKCPGMPSEKRLAQGPVAVIECVQEIPCNPCEAACPFGAIRVGEPITSLPVLDEEKCTGCGACVAACPGLAIFTVNMAYSETEAAVAFPYEYRPLPAKNDLVEAVDRQGRVVGRGRVLDVKMPRAFKQTAVVTLAVAKALGSQVRSMAPFSTKDKLICRCQEVTQAMIEEAIDEGAFSVDGIKKRTRAGMGLCQGKSCERLVAKIIADKTGQDPADVLPATSRPPVRPIKMGTIEGERNA